MTRQIAESFSRHDFAETYEHIADDVTWTAIGAGPTHGKAALVEICEQLLADLEQTTTEFLTFRSVAELDDSTGDGAVAVDSLSRYVGADGTVSVVASCDLFDFVDGRVQAITTYVAEVPDPADNAS